MDIFTKPLGRYPIGIWLALLALAILFLVAWAGQAYSLIDWSGAVELGLQNDRFTGDAVEQTWAKENWGNAAAVLAGDEEDKRIFLMGGFTGVFTTQSTVVLGFRRCRPRTSSDRS